MVAHGNIEMVTMKVLLLIFLTSYFYRNLRVQMVQRKKEPRQTNKPLHWGIPKIYQPTYIGLTENSSDSPNSSKFQWCIIIFPSQMPYIAGIPMCTPIFRQTITDTLASRYFTAKGHCDPCGVSRSSCKASEEGRKMQIWPMEIRNKSRKTLEFKPHWENSLGFKLPVSCNCQTSGYLYSG